VDESEIGSANETATFGSPFHFPGRIATPAPWGGGLGVSDLLAGSFATVIPTP
jgi:hypothetical protein